MVIKMKDSVNRAFLYALKVHDGQKRKDGKPYIVHPFAVANILTENGAEKDLVCAGLLHDVIEDGGVTAEELQKNGAEYLFSSPAEITDLIGKLNG